MIHWPTSIISEPGEANRLATWKALVEMKSEGFVRSIGVSNFTPKHLKPFLSLADNKPVVNQIEVHPLGIDEEVIQLCQDNGIAIIAYAPLATFDDRLMKNPLVESLSTKYGKSPNQIVLRWAIQRNFIVIPKSSQREHIHSNISIGDF